MLAKSTEELLESLKDDPGYGPTLERELGVVDQQIQRLAQEEATHVTPHAAMEPISEDFDKHLARLQELKQRISQVRERLQ